jgi:hypothetical protein
MGCPRAGGVVGGEDRRGGVSRGHTHTTPTRGARTQGDLLQLGTSSLPPINKVMSPAHGTKAHMHDRNRGLLGLLVRRSRCGTGVGATCEADV